MNNYSIMLMENTIKATEEEILKLVKIHAKKNERCVDASIRLIKEWHKRRIIYNQVDEIRLVYRVFRIRIDGRNMNFEHSWVEVRIGNKWFVVDITGKQQFQLKKIAWKREDYLKMTRRAEKNPMSVLTAGIIGALVTSPLYVVHRYLYDKYLQPMIKKHKGGLKKNPLEDRVIIKESPTHASHRYPVTVDDIRKALSKFTPEHLALLVKEGIEIHLAKPGYMVQSGTKGQCVKSRKVINIYSIKTRREKDGKLKFQHFWPTVMIMFRTQPPSWISEEDAKLIALNSTLPHEIGHAVHMAMKMKHQGLRIGELGEEELFATAFEKNFQATHGIMQTRKTAYELAYLPFRSSGIQGVKWLKNPGITLIKCQMCGKILNKGDLVAPIDTGSGKAGRIYFCKKCAGGKFKLRIKNPFVKPGDSIKAFIPATGVWIKAKVLSEPKEKAECLWIRIMHDDNETTAVWNDIGKFYVVGSVE